MMTVFIGIAIVVIQISILGIGGYDIYFDRQTEEEIKVIFFLKEG